MVVYRIEFKDQPLCAYRFYTLQEAVAQFALIKDKESCTILATTFSEDGIISRPVTEEEKYFASYLPLPKPDPPVSTEVPPVGKNCYAVHTPDCPGYDCEYPTLAEAAQAKTVAGEQIYALDENSNPRPLTEEEEARVALLIFNRLIKKQSDRKSHTRTLYS